jgi:hypothetical protein
MEIEGAKEPNDDACQEDDREGSLQEIFGFVPQQAQHIVGNGEAIVGKFHDKRYGFTSEKRMFHDDGCKDADQDA